MQLEHNYLGFDGQDEQVITTEVLLDESEKNIRSILEAKIRYLGLPHDPTVFPERLVLNGLYCEKRVQDLVSTWSKRQTTSLLPTSYGKRPAMKDITASEKYL